METIRLLLEYGTYPLWLLDDEGMTIDTALPTEWSDDKELDTLLTEIMSKYDQLFIDNKKEFRYVGFKEDVDKNDFIDKLHLAVDMVTAKNAGKYKIINDFHIDEL